MSATLTKSAYVAALQCQRRLWLEEHAPERAAAPDGITLSLREEAHAIGRAAHGLFPGGVTVHSSHFETAVKDTRELLARPDVPAIFEAAFEADRVRIRVDVLERLQTGLGGLGGFGLREVKASSSLREDHLDDLVIQLQVLRRSGLDVRSIELVHVRDKYVHPAHPGEELDPRRFFVRRDVREDIEFLVADAQKQQQQFLDVLDSDAEPAVEPSPHCRRPRLCPFFDHCRRDKPANWIGALPALRSASFHALRERGVAHIEDIPEEAVLNPRQQRAVAAHRDPRGVAVSPELGSLLSGAGPPAAYLDFETFNPGIPEYPGTRPFQPIPCQWSLHRINAEGTLSHREFLAPSGADPRPAFAESLIRELGVDAVPILVYSSFEASVLGELAAAYPAYAAPLGRIRVRLFDLLQTVRAGIYDRRFAGSFSLKSVAAALSPGFGYADLEAVRNGGDAALALTRLMREHPPGDESADEGERLRRALLRYCARDTQALVEVHRALLEHTRGDLTG